MERKILVGKNCSKAKPVISLQGGPEFANFIIP